MRSLRGLLLLLVLALAACGTETTGPASGSDGGVSDGEVSVGTGEVADLDFSATTLQGEEFSGTSLEESPTVLWFWAPWCPTCRAQIPTVSGLGDEYDERVDVIGVGGFDTRGEIEELAASIDHVTHLVDVDGTVWQHFGVTAQSTYTVIDADGVIVHEGYLDNGALEDLVADLAG